MKIKIFAGTSFLFLLLAGGAAFGFGQNPGRKTTANAVCPDPRQPCKNVRKCFSDWEMPFNLPAKLRANQDYQSAPFYAVILKIYDAPEECDGGEYIKEMEKDRLAEQKNQPDRKVFADYQCPNMNAVGYDFAGKTNADGDRIVISNFIAVYAGKTEADGNKLLILMKKKYPQAILKLMTAQYQLIEQ